MGTLDPVSDYRSLIGRKDVDNFDNGNEYMHPRVVFVLAFVG